jgi:hypothetical protein
MSLFAYIPIPPQTFSVLSCSCVTIYIGTDSLRRQPHLTSASDVTANGSTAIFLWFRRPPSCLVHCPFPPAASRDILQYVPFPAFRPRAGRSPAHTWVPSPPPERVRFGGMKRWEPMRTRHPLLPRGFDSVAGVTSKSTVFHSHLQPCPDSPTRLIVSHGPAHSRILDNRYSSELHKHQIVPSSSTFKDPNSS